MAWMRLEDAVRDHPKIMEAAADLSIAKVQMIGHLVLLWTWALRNAPDGDLRGRSPRHIALVCEWTGDADAFVGVLQRCRMLDGNASDGTARVHDWMGAGRERSSLSDVEREYRNEVRRVYLLHAPELGLLKIGESIDVGSRFRTLRSDMPDGVSLVLLGSIPGRDADVHVRFSDLRLPPQPHLPAPTEWFLDRPQIRAFFLEVE